MCPFRQMQIKKVLSPNDIILIPIGSPVDIRGKEGLFAVGIYEPAEGGMAAHQVDRVVDAQIHQGLREVVHGFVGLADGHE